MKKTNAMRELDKAKIEYQTHHYEVNEEHLGAIDVALSLGQDIRRVFKTLILLNEKKEMIVACIPGSDSIDLKKLAKLLSTKKVEMLEMKLLLSMTGYIRGGCSPIGIVKKHKTIVHDSVLQGDKIMVSGGMRGIQIELSVEDFLRYLDPMIGDIIVS